MCACETVKDTQRKSFGDAAISPGPHKHTHVAGPANSTRGLCGATKQEAREHRGAHKTTRTKTPILTGADISKRKHRSFCVPPLMSGGFTYGSEQHVAL